jgi:hypothetical protein
LNSLSIKLALPFSFDHIQNFPVFKFVPNMLLENDQIVPSLADETLSSTDSYESDKSSTATTNIVITIRKNGEETPTDPSTDSLPSEGEESICRLREIKSGFIRRQTEKLNRLKMGEMTTVILATARNFFYSWRDSFVCGAGDLCTNQYFVAAMAFLIGLLIGLVLGRNSGAKPLMQFHGTMVPFLPIRPKEVYF